jgi:hypothetical protein
MEDGIGSDNFSWPLFFKITVNKPMLYVLKRISFTALNYSLWSTFYINNKGVSCLLKGRTQT